MPLILGTNSIKDTGYDVANSCRFNDGDSAYMHKTFGTGGSTTAWTMSMWVKRGVLGTDQRVFSCDDSSDGDPDNYWRFKSDDTLQVNIYNSSAIGNLVTNRKFRDCSSWYHVCVIWKSGDSTSTDRLQLWVNGTRETSFSATTFPSQDANSITASQVIAVGRRNYAGEQHFDGYLAEVVFLDGVTASPVDTLGEFDSDSPTIFKPKDPSGLSFGSTGFYLDFEDSANLGNDANGGTDLTEVNLAATDQATDTPTNNFCTINPIFADSGNNIVQAAFSEGNTKMLTTVDGWKFGRGTFLLTSGKWYVEAKVTEASAGQNGNLGIVPSQGGIVLGESDDNAVFEGLRAELGGSDTILRKLDTGTGTEVFNDLASGDTVMLAIDLDNNKLWVGNEGTWYNDNNASTTLDASNHDVGLPTVTEGWLFGVGQYRDSSNNLTWEYNWGNPPNAISSSNADANGYGNFEFAVPSGFYAPCTKNLAEFG